MIELHLRVVYQGDKVEAHEFKASDLVALERQFNLSLPNVRGFTFEQCCFLIWRLLKRERGLDVPFDDAFLDGIEDLEDLGNDPLPPAAEAGAPSPGEASPPT